MHSVRIELAKMILVGTRITYQATGDADMFTIYTYQVYEYIYIYVLIIFALLFSLPLVVTQIRGHIAGSSPPLPTTVRAFHFYTSALPSSTRVELCSPTLGALSSLSLLYFANKFKISPDGGIRAHGPTLQVEAFEGYH